MAITVDYGTYVITVPRTDMTLIQTTPIEIRELNMDSFRRTLRDLEDDEAGMPQPTMCNYVAPFTISGTQLARIVEILDPYTVTFEDGQYAVNLVNANTNLQDKVNINQVSVRPSNSAGLVQTRELEYSSYQEGVWLDLLGAVSGTAYPIGTPQLPVNNLADALFIASLRGFNRLYLVAEDNDFGAGDTVTGMELIGVRGETHTHLDPGSSFTNCDFENMHLHGDLFGITRIHNCNIGTLTGANGEAHNCVLEAGTTTLAAGGNWNIITGVSGIAGTAMHYIDCNGSGEVQVRGYNGGLHISNKTSNAASIDMSSGNLMIDMTCTGGIIVCRGVCSFNNMANGADVRVQGLITEELRLVRHVMESMYETHQAYGNVYYVEPVGGLDTNDGRSEETAFATVNKALAEVVSGRSDLIILLSPIAGVATIDERIDITKEDVHIRGSGRGIQFQPSTTGLGPVIRVSANNCSFSGFIVRSPVGELVDDAIVVDGKFSLFEKLYLVGPGQNLVGSVSRGLVITAGDYHELHNMEIEKFPGCGFETDDSNGPNGNPREITISGGNYYLNGGNGICLRERVGSTPGTTTRIVRIIGQTNIHANTGYGIISDPNTTEILVGNDVLVHGNNGNPYAPQVDLQGTGSDLRMQGLVSYEITKIRQVIESVKQTHQAYGTVYYVDPGNGNDANDGQSQKTAFKTITAGYNACADGQNDLVLITNTGTPGLVITEELTITKNNVHIRGDSRNVIWRGVNANGTILTVDGYNCSIQGILLDGNSFSDYCCVVNGKFFKAIKPWMKLANVDCLLIRGGDYHEILDCEIEKAVTGAGIATFDAGLPSGSPREITIMGVEAGANIYLNTGEGVRIDATPGAGLGNTTRIVRFLGHCNIHANGGYGVSSQADADAVMIGGMTHIHGNNGGHMQPQFNLLGESHNELEEKPHHIAEAVWDYATDDIATVGSVGLYVKNKLLTVGKFLGLK